MSFSNFVSVQSFWFFIRFLTYASDRSASSVLGVVLCYFQVGFTLLLWQKQSSWRCGCCKQMCDVSRLGLEIAVPIACPVSSRALDLHLILFNELTCLWQCNKEFSCKTYSFPVSAFETIVRDARLTAWPPRHVSWLTLTMTFCNNENFSTRLLQHRFY